MSKKVIAAVALAAVLALGLCACGSYQASSSASASAGSSSSAAASSASSSVASSATSAASASAASVEQFATMKDLIAAFDGMSEWEYDDKELIYSTTDGKNYARVWCDLTPEVKSALKEISGGDIDCRKPRARPPRLLSPYSTYFLPCKGRWRAQRVGGVSPSR